MRNMSWQIARVMRIAIILTMAFALFAGLCACESSHYTTGTEKSSSATSSSNDAKQNQDQYEDSWRQPKQTTPETYVDPRWPTTNSQLLAIPEEQRWYNAWGSVETTCTIAGPVIDVYQATNEYGAPIFVNIGADYPDPDCVTLVIWADDEAEFDSTLHDIDHGNAWISVTSYLTTYNGYLQFSTDNYVEWTYWTEVR